MELVGATWTVVYNDGSRMTQYDAGHPAAVNGEVPYRTIDWPAVRKLIFESQYVIREFDISHPGPEFQMSLHSRHFMTAQGAGTHCYLVATRPIGRPKEEAVSVLYWFPDDSMHQCYLYDCPEVRSYGCGLVHETGVRLMPEHHCVQLLTDSVLEATA